MYIAKSAENDVSCSEKVVYDAVGSTLEMSTRDNMICSMNVAYTTMTEAKKDGLKASSTGNVAVYDEISTRK